MKQLLLVLCFGIIYPFNLYSQQNRVIIDAKAVADAGKVFITYDMLSNVNGEIFDVEVYASHDDFQKPLKFVTGNVGSNIKKDVNMKIEWDAQRELTKFHGEISFEVRAHRTYAPITFTNVAGQTFKRAKTHKITWEGGSRGENLSFELWKRGRFVQYIGNSENDGEMDWRIPRKVNKGRRYQIKVTGSKYPETFYLSQNFKVKRKVPRFFKWVIFLGGTYYLLTAFELYEPDNPEGQHLPMPPSP